MDLDEMTLTLIDPQDMSVLNIQPIHSIRVWGVGRDNGRYACMLITDPYLPFTFLSHSLLMYSSDHTELCRKNAQKCQICSFLCVSKRVTNESIWFVLGALCMETTSYN